MHLEGDNATPHYHRQQHGKILKMLPNPESHEEQSKSLGGLPTFRDLDLPEAFCPPSYHGCPTVTLPMLEQWFSPPRIHRYANSQNPADLYVWNTRLSKAFLEDVAHVEVLLRNFIHTRLTANSGCRWFDDNHRYHFNRPFQHSVIKAKKRLAKSHRKLSADSIIAELSFDSWRFLLSARHEVTIWRVLTAKANGGMPHYPSRNRGIFEKDVETIRKLRNRASHHEPFIIEVKPSEQEITLLDQYQQSLDLTARRINPVAADWIKTNSRVAALRAMRPDS